MLVKLFLNISFWPIQAYYVAFFDWRRIMQRLAICAYKERLTLEFDASQPASARLVAVSQSIDFFGMVDYQSSDSPIDETLGIRVGGKTGWAAVAKLVPYVPLLWLCLPVCFRSSLRSGSKLRPEANQQVPTPSPSRGVFAVGTAVLLANTLCGFSMVDSWPVGVYPTFATIIGPSVSSLAIEGVNTEGKILADVEVFFDPAIRAVYPSERLAGVVGAALHAKVDRTGRLVSLWNIWQAKHPEVIGVTELRFYVAYYPISVGADRAKPLRRELLEVVSPANAQSIPPTH
jgi:hypothetical protein